jgi:plasmid stabilization system protein ParE
MLPIVWLPAARRNLAAILGFIAEHNPAAARRIKNVIEDSVLPLAEHPYLFRTGRSGYARGRCAPELCHRLPRDGHNCACASCAARASAISNGERCAVTVRFLSLLPAR